MRACGMRVCKAKCVCPSGSGGRRTVVACVRSCSKVSNSGTGNQRHDLRLPRIHGAVWTGRCEGVTEAKVSLAMIEAVVNYDPDVVKIDGLIKAVKNARGMNSYDATVKQK